MTDRETLIAMLDHAGIVHEVVEAVPQRQEQGVHECLRVVEGAGPANRGYAYFLTDFEFDEHGHLLAMGMWE